MDIREFFSGKKTKLIIEDDDNEVQNLLETYKNCDFIPNNIIQKVLSSLMPRAEIIHKYSDRHFILKIKVNDLLTTSITNWKYNRPPDMVRCADISKYIYLSKSPLDTMLYLNFNNVLFYV